MTEQPDLYNPQSLNRYSYTLNSPVKYVDPSGHWTVDIEDELHTGPYAPSGTTDYSYTHPLINFTGEKWTHGEKEM